MEQHEFSSTGENGCSITVTLTEVFGFPGRTCFIGGYEVRATATIKVGGFDARANFTTSTGEFYSFMQALDRAQSTLSGQAIYDSFEQELSFEINYQLNGIVEVQGTLAPSSSPGTELRFSFQSDQSFLQATHRQLIDLATIYGDMKGVC